MEGNTKTFPKGMHSDNDPRYQPEGTYRDATNVKLISEDGDSFTIENVQGNRETLTIPCAPTTYEITLNVDPDNSNTLVAGTAYKWYLHYTTYDAAGTTASNTYVEIAEIEYSTTKALCEHLRDAINALTTSFAVPGSMVALPYQLFYASSSGEKVVIHSIAHPMTGSYTILQGIGPATGSYAAGNTGYSHKVAGAVSFTNNAGSYSEGNTPIYLKTRLAKLCNLEIVGYFSYKKDLFLFTYDSVLGSSNGQLWKFSFYNDKTASSDLNSAEVTLLYNNTLNFAKTSRISCVGIVENSCIQRLYWTDFINPLRSFNYQDSDSFAYELNDLKSTPRTDFSEPYLTSVDIGGQLEVGMYQYCYKLITAGGGKSSLSTMSGLIPLTKGNTADPEDVNTGDASVGFASAGEISDKSITIRIDDLDISFKQMEVYALKFIDYNTTPSSIKKIKTLDLNNQPSVSVVHSDDDGDDVLLAELLIEGNTFSLCKDIAIKDNILFAANLKTEEVDLDAFDTAVYRWLADDVQATTGTGSWSGLDFTDGTGLEDGRKTDDTINFDKDTYLYLPYAVKDSSGNNQVLLGAQTQYFDSTKGGVRITFDTNTRIADTESDYNYTNLSNGYFVSSAVYAGQGNHHSLADKNQLVNKLGGSSSSQYKIDNNSENNILHPNPLDYEGGENPYYTSVHRGYQRGETYRFGIAFFDKNGRSLETKWIGDIKMPEHSDEHWRFRNPTDLTEEWLDTDGDGVGDAATGGSGYKLFDSGNRMVHKNIYCEDYRLSYIPGLRNPYNDYENHALTDETMDKDIFPYWKPAYKAGGINEVPLQKSTDYRYPNFDSSGSITGDTSFDDLDFVHRINDLCLRFEVIIPTSLENSIGGYKIVRVKREKKDRTILYQGLLTQTVKYIESHNERISGEWQQSEWDNKLKNRWGPWYGEIWKTYNTYKHIFGVNPSVASPSEMSSSNKLGQFDILNGEAIIGYNKLFTFNSPDLLHNLDQYTHISGSQLSVVSVLKSVDVTRNKEDDTKIGSNKSVEGLGNRTRFHGELFTAHGGAAAALDGDPPHYTYSKFYTYDTKSFVYNLDSNYQTLTNLLGTPVSGSPSSGRWNNNIEIKDASMVGRAAKKSGISGFGSNVFTNNCSTYSIPKTGSQGFHTGTSLGNRLNYKYRKGAIDKCEKTLVLYLDSILNARDIDHIYCNKNDAAKFGTGNPTHISGNSTIASGDLPNNLIPYRLLCNITTTRVNQYGGKDDAAKKDSRYIDTGNYVFVGDDISLEQTSLVKGGDVYVNFYGTENKQGGSIHTDDKYAGDSSAMYYPVESHVNIDLVHGEKKLRDRVGENYTLNGPNNLYDNYRKQETWDYNPVYSQESDVKGYLQKQIEDCTVVHLPNEIAYSSTKMAGDLVDAWKNFPPASFHDVDGIHGEINKIFNLNNEIYFLQDSAVGALAVNPRTIISTEDGTQIYTGTGDTVQNHQYISTNVGSQHQWSFIPGIKAVYFVDVLRAKMMSFNGQNITSLSDQYGMRTYLKTVCEGLDYKDSLVSLSGDGDNRIQIQVNDTPLNYLGVHGGFNQGTGDVVYTFFDKYLDGTTAYSFKKKTLVFNENLNLFTTQLSVKPTLWVSHFNTLFSTNGNIPTPDSNVYEGQSDNYAIPKQLWEWEGSKDSKLTTIGSNTRFPRRNTFFTNRSGSFDVTFVINESPQSTKIFDNMAIVVDVENWENVTPTTVVSKTGDNLTNLIDSTGYSAAFTSIVMNTELSDFSNIGEHTLTNAAGTSDTRYIYREGTAYFPTRQDGKGRLKGTYMIMKCTADTTNKFNIFALRPFFRKSY